METVKIRVNDRKFEAELADDLFSQVKGFSFRSEGKMLFAFDSPTRANIDMMFLSRPLYLYFMDSEKKVIEVQRAEPWSWNPRTWKLYSPGRPYSYLLESFEELDVGEGDRLEFEL